MTSQKKETLLDRLDADPKVLGGQMCVRGTRISVTLILDALAAEETVENILHGYPTLTRDDIQAALAYAAKLAHERILPLARTSCSSDSRLTA